jgi:hypothetical protein
MGSTTQAAITASSVPLVVTLGRVAHSVSTAPKTLIRAGVGRGPLPPPPRRGRATAFRGARSRSSEARTAAHASQKPLSYPPHSIIRKVGGTGSFGYDKKVIQIGYRWAGARVRVTASDSGVHARW